MPRIVIPEGLMVSSSPQTFSLGECKLTITMECSSMRNDGEASEPEYRISVSNGAKSLQHGSLGLFRERETEGPRSRKSRRLLRQLVVEMQNHHDETRKNKDAGNPALRVGCLPFA